MQPLKTITDEILAAVEQFVQSSGFGKHGAVITDLDGTAVHEDGGRIQIPRSVELGLRAVYELGHPVILNTLRFPLSIMRTFGKEWLAISGAPIPVVSMNGSQLGWITRDANGELCMDEIAAFPLSSNDIDSVLAGVEALIGDDIRDLLLFYYPRDWRLGEVIWTPVAEKVLHVKDKYSSASSVVAVETEKLEEMLHSEEICMIFLLVERPADFLMAYQHSKPSNFFNAKGINKRTGVLEMAERLNFVVKSSVGAGDTPMDTFLDSVGLSIQIGASELPFRGRHSTVRLRNSFEFGDALFHIAGLLSKQQDGFNR